MKERKKTSPFQKVQDVRKYKLAPTSSKDALGSRNTPIIRAYVKREATQTRVGFAFKVKGDQYSEAKAKRAFGRVLFGPDDDIGLVILPKAYSDDIAALRDALEVIVQEKRLYNNGKPSKFWPLEEQQNFKNYHIFATKKKAKKKKLK